jgi:hypothetical protein
VLTGIGLALLGVPLALPLAVLVFLGAFLPYIGAIVTGLLAVLVALASGGPTLALAVVALIVVVQQLDGNVIEPLITGRVLQLPAVPTSAGWSTWSPGGFRSSAPTTPRDGEQWTSGAWSERFRMLPGETLGGLLDEYEQVARRSDDLVATLPDLDSSHPLPEAPWFEPGARWSARRVLLHVIAETAQHAGHADIIRESLDGAKSMG